MCTWVFPTFTFEKNFPSSFFTVMFWDVNKVIWHRNQGCVGLRSAHPWSFQFDVRGQLPVSNLKDQDTDTGDFSGARTGVTLTAWLL